MKRGFAAALLTLTFGAAAFAISLMVAPYPVADFAAVRGAWRASDAWLLDRHGEPLSRLRIDRQRRRGEWVKAVEVSPALTAAVLASEDKRFHAHSGIDALALLGALKQSALGGRRGGSTLTMQLAAYLHPELDTGEIGRASCRERV